MTECPGESLMFLMAPPFKSLAALAGGEAGMGADIHALICHCCGWWKFTRSLDFVTRSTRQLDVSYDGCFGLLKRLDVSNVDLPCEEIRRYLVANYIDRFHVNPRKFEEVVGSVFRSLGYDSRVTAYSADGGIDIFLDGPGDTLIGVQVKRSRNSIEVGQVRELTGALVLAGITKGIFVTTSRFQKGAYAATELSRARGIPIALIDASRLFDALKLSCISSYVDGGTYPWQPFKEYLAAQIEEELDQRRRLRSTRPQRKYSPEIQRLDDLARGVEDEEDLLLIEELRSVKDQPTEQRS